MTTPARYPAFDGTQACVDVDPELFFPSPTTGVERTPQAVAVCGHCSFKRECLAYGLTHGVHGIWGGTTAATRDEIRRQHRIQAEPVSLSDGATRWEQVRASAAAGTPPQRIAEQHGVWLETVYRILGRTST